MFDQMCKTKVKHFLNCFYTHLFLDKLADRLEDNLSSLNKKFSKFEGEFSKMKKEFDEVKDSVEVRNN